jgi:hypothetical protein
MANRAATIVPKSLGWPGRALAAFVRFWHGALSDRPDKYWPERHYMRGPGPKWREKHGGASQ